jgi:hypothetical protein
MDAKINESAIEGVPPNCCHGSVSLPPRGKPLLRTLAARSRDLLRALCRRLRGPVLAAGINVGPTIFCRALFGLVSKLAHTLGLSNGVPRTLIRLYCFFDRGQCSNRFIDVFARTVFDSLSRLAR